MQVLEKPKTKEQWSQTVTCDGVNKVREGCGAKLAITEDDLFRVKVGAEGFVQYIAQYQCPECGVRSDLPTYPNASVLMDYWQHPQYRKESDLTGYEQERWAYRWKKRI
jgi:hypothetical protein